MSRTYRLCHLPRRRCWKFVDGNIHRRRFSKERELQEFIRNAGHTRWAAWHIEWELSRNDPQWFTPVGSKGDHPWISWWWVNGAKTYYRSRGNRVCRRKTRIEIKRYGELFDDWTGHWPGRRERLNKWDLS